MKRLAVAAFLLLLVTLGAILWWKTSLLPFNSSDKTDRNFVVAEGESVRQVAKDLKDQNLVRDQISFFLLIRLGLEKSPQAGNFTLNPGMSTADIAKALTRGTDDLRLTIPEGWRREQILDYLRGQNIPGPEGAWNEEGKYFPETYLVSKDTTIDEVRVLMRRTFDAKVPAATVTQLVVASMIEREARYPADRPLIASVIYNRLEAGMALDIDATIQYALGFWKQDLTLEDLKIRSPYNTYLNPGLPPGPICNPGLASIQAAINPAKTDYLFYLADKNGVTYYAKTLDEHNANVAKYLQ